VVTLPGTGMASRVAASLLSAARVPALVARTAPDYAALAAALARSARARAHARDALAARRAASPLLDTAAWVQVCPPPRPPPPPATHPLTRAAGVFGRRRGSGC